MTEGLALNTVHEGDCLELMRDIPDGSVDMVLCDLPYGTTACKWDTIIPFDLLWEQYERVIKSNGAIILFAKQPFTSALIMSNPKLYKYNLVWVKENHDNPLMAKKRFLNISEDICIFYKKQCVYNPQGVLPYNKETRQGKGKSMSQRNERTPTYKQGHTNYPRNIRRYKKDRGFHPTQKPVLLCDELIKTFTNEGEIVLDNCMGSGTTAVACFNINRKYIGFELDEDYFNKANERIKDNEKVVK